MVKRSMKDRRRSPFDPAETASIEEEAPWCQYGMFEHEK